MNSEVHSLPSVQNVHLRLLGWGLPFVGFSLPKIGNRFGGLPERVVQSSVESRWMLNWNGFCHTSFRLGNWVRFRSYRTGVAAALRRQCSN